MKRKLIVFVCFLLILVMGISACNDIEDSEDTEEVEETEDKKETEKETKKDKETKKETEEDTEKDTDEDLVQSVRFTKDILKGTLITEECVELVYVHAEYVPENTIQNIEDVLGMYLTVDVYKGEFVFFRQDHGRRSF